MVKNIKKSLISLLFFAMSIFLVINILYSQNISDLYFQLVKEDKSSVVNFLIKIKLLPGFTDFNNQLNEYKDIYGKSIETEVFAKDIQRKETIKELKELLDKNPKSRDVLYNLYLLEKEDGNQIEAETYLKKTQKLDPSIGN